MVMEDLPHYMIFEPRPEESKGVNHVDMTKEHSRKKSIYKSLTLTHAGGSKKEQEQCMSGAD